MVENVIAFYKIKLKYFFPLLQHTIAFICRDIVLPGVNVLQLLSQRRNISTNKFFLPFNTGNIFDSKNGLNVYSGRTLLPCTEVDCYIYYGRKK